MTTPATVRIPGPSGARTVELLAPPALITARTPPLSRLVYAAGHVVADPLRAAASVSATIDWDATMAVRHRLWALGLGVAESMDTAQRGMGLDAATALELGRRTVREAASCGGQVVVGIATDQLPAGPATLTAIGDAYLEQLEQIESAGGCVVVMASRQLALSAASVDDYLAIYGRVIEAASRAVILHWLGAMFDPQLAGYWGSDDLDAAVDTVVTLVNAHADAVVGIKVSLLDAGREGVLRRRLPEGVRVFAGDDFNYAELIAGDESGHCDALLGAFAVIPRYASAALLRLDAADTAGFHTILDPTVALSRLLFEAPTQFYKTGVAWLSFLMGDQSHFRMLAGLESGRTVLHLADLLAEAAGIGLFPDPELAVDRATGYFRGIGL